MTLSHSRLSHFLGEGRGGGGADDFISDQINSSFSVPVIVGGGGGGGGELGRCDFILEQIV